MSIGIVTYGAYIPIYRLSAETLSQTWGKPLTHGEKAVANWDEDSLTMAVEATTNCLKGVDRQRIDGLYFASTTPAYREKQSASIIAKVLDLRRDVVTADITNSLRSGTSALRSAEHAIKAGTAKRFLVAAADCRIPAPDSEFEQLFGDGAAALLLGDSDVAVEIEGNYSISSEFMDIWKRDDDKYVRTWEDRFVVTHGYLEHLVEVVTGLFKKYDLSQSDFTKAIFYGYDLRRHAELSRRLGFDHKTQVQDPLLTAIGNTGSASSLMMLVGALEESKPGDRLLFACYGDGADAFVLKVTDQIEKVRDCRGIKKHLARKMMLPNYGKYLHFRNLVEWEARREPDNYASLTVSWRDRNWILSCKGQICNECSTIQFPPQRICTWCQAKDKFNEINLSDKKGMLFTYSVDNLAVSVDPPTINAVINLEPGGRFATIMTDRDIEKITVGMPVELTFRRFHEGQGIHNYYWKCRPAIE